MLRLGQSGCHQALRDGLWLRLLNRLSFYAREHEDRTASVCEKLTSMLAAVWPLLLEVNYSGESGEFRIALPQRIE